MLEMVLTKVLEPGLTVRKARLMMELHLPLLMLAQIEVQQGAEQVNKSSVKNDLYCLLQGRIKKDFQKGLITLKLALKVIQYGQIFSTNRVIHQLSTFFTSCLTRPLGGEKLRDKIYFNFHLI